MGKKRKRKKRKISLFDRMPDGIRDFFGNRYAMISAVLLVIIFAVVLIVLGSRNMTDGEDAASVSPEQEEERIIYIIDEQGNRVAVPAVDDDELVMQNEIKVDDETGTILAYNPDTREGYMNHCIFLGDSRTVAMVSYGYISDSNALAKVGIAHTAVAGTTFTQNSGNTYTISDYLKARTEEVIYVCYGVNGMNGISEEQYESSYTELVDKIISLAGDRHVVLMSIWPVDDNGRYRGSVKNEWIDKYNDFLYRLASEKGLYYLDVASILKDENGGMRREYDSGDGLHYSASSYGHILDYIIHHPVPGVPDDGEFVVHYVKPRVEHRDIIDEAPEIPQPATESNDIQPGQDAVITDSNASVSPSGNEQSPAGNIFSPAGDGQENAAGEGDILEHDQSDRTEQSDNGTNDKQPAEENNGSGADGKPEEKPE
ncbi:MAG: hypothetical protein K6E53_08300, partial [Lachnospiraceae bacterium]|nr:hypothetical protein [Lachnospiraceae bacterium]